MLYSTGPGVDVTDNDKHSSVLGINYDCQNFYSAVAWAGIYKRFI